MPMFWDNRGKRSRQQCVPVFGRLERSSTSRVPSNLQKGGKRVLKKVGIIAEKRGKQCSSRFWALLFRNKTQYMVNHRCSLLSVCPSYCRTPLVSLTRNASFYNWLARLVHHCFSAYPPESATWASPLRSWLPYYTKLRMDVANRGFSFRIIEK